MSISFNITNLKTRIATIVENAKPLIKQAENGKNWQEVFAPLDEVYDALGKETALQSHLSSVKFSEKFNQEYETTLPLISDFYTELGTNKKLYQAFKNLESQDLNSNQTYILENVLKDFQFSGIDLSKEKQQKYKEISAKLSVLSNDFSKNSLQATNNYKKIVKKSNLKGLNATELAKLENNGDNYTLSLQTPAYLAVMTYCENRELRKELYTAYISKASEFDEFDNTKIMDEILSLRKELANLLGFGNYAQYSLATKMVKQPKEVEGFLNDLVQKSRPQAEQELQNLEEFAGIKLKPWDIAFYSEQQKQQLYGFSKSEVAQYFPFQQVLSGLLDLIQELYGVSAKIVDEQTYNKDVIALEFDNGAKVYIDPYARKDKRSGAWMNDYQGLNKEQKPIAFVVCNSSKPTKTTPSLLEFDDVITLFHEFGHALHHILTKVKYPSVAGINGVPWDGVELPSQYMEFFAYEKKVIAKISQHHQSGEILPDELFDKLIASKNYQSALAMLRQCEFGLWDILTHQSEKNTYKVLDEVREKTSLLDSIPQNRFLNSFGHIFSGGYAAGYYSYKWAEVMAADAYAIVQKDKNKTRDFYRHILTTGGESDFMQNYIAFSGKKPDIIPLLKSSGIQ